MPDLLLRPHEQQPEKQLWTEPWADSVSDPEEPDERALHRRRDPNHDEPPQFLSKKKWNGQAPIDLFIKIYGQEAA